MMKSSPKSRRNFLTKMLGFLGVSSLVAKTSTLSAEEIVKAWEDPEFRNNLTDDQWNALPDNPAGEVEYSQFKGSITGQISGNNCSGNNCSGNNCSGNNCSGNNCSGNNCSGNNCSGNNCGGFPS